MNNEVVVLSEVSKMTDLVMSKRQRDHSFLEKKGLYKYK